MTQMRSWLFAPGDCERKMAKATASGADIVIYDLEDAVSEAEKPKARTMVTAFLKSNVQHWLRGHAVADEQLPDDSRAAGKLCVVPWL